MIAARLANIKREDTLNRGPRSANLPNGVSQPEAAKLMGVSSRLVRSAKTIERDAPSLITQIEAGKMTIHEAEKKIAWQKTQDYALRWHGILKMISVPLTTERLKTSETTPPTPRSRSRRRSNPKNQRLQSDLVLLAENMIGPQKLERFIPASVENAATAANASR